MEPILEFGNLVTGLQHLPEREKIILVALINAHGTQNVDTAKLERLIAQTIIAAARENQRGPDPKIPARDVMLQSAAIISRIHEAPSAARCCLDPAAVGRPAISV